MSLVQLYLGKAAYTFCNSIVFKKKRLFLNAFMKMIKTILVFVLTASFLLEDILVIMVPVDQIIFCQEEDGKVGDVDNSDEKKENISKDELRNFYRTVSVFTEFTVLTSLKSSREKIYDEHFVEIYTPPPDLA